MWYLLNPRGVFKFVTFILDIPSQSVYRLNVLLWKTVPVVHNSCTSQIWIFLLQNFHFGMVSPGQISGQSHVNRCTSNMLLSIFCHQKYQGTLTATHSVNSCDNKREHCDDLSSDLRPTSRSLIVETNVVHCSTVKVDCETV